MGDDDHARDAAQAGAGIVVNGSRPNPESLDSVKGTLGDYEQYSDIMIIATLQDCAHAGRALELNERPAFKHSPGNVARLLLNEKQEGLLTYVTNKYA
ncbi:MAG: hypothetical protein EB824_03665 [Thaumarchaeota archaeon S15]|nr:MAG: hypothetical protein EB824_03665 [Thaumarchaeota archaeon S15]